MLDVSREVIELRVLSCETGFALPFLKAG